MSPARIRYEAPSSEGKAFDLTSPARKPDDAENDRFPSGKNYAVVIETPKKRKRDGRIPFQPLTMPVVSSQTQAESINQSGEFLPS
jgi:hypothetical protein